MSYFRTAAFKVHTPSGRKLRRVRRMQRLYSSVYCDALRALKDEDPGVIESFPSAGERKAKDLVLKLLGEQPLEGAMWDGLIADLQLSVRTYLETPGASFPAPSGSSSASAEELVEELLTPSTWKEEERLKAELKRKDEAYERPINFVRFRNNPIIRSENGEKLWVAPHFQAGREGGPAYLPENGESIDPERWNYTQLEQKKKECLPIECGRWHFCRFFRNGTPVSSKVYATEEDIYVLYTFRFEEPDRSEHDPETDPVLGVDRGERITAAYGVVSPSGTLLEKGSSASELLRSRLREIDRKISEARSEGRRPDDLWDRRRNLVEDALHRISNRIVEAAARHGAAIAFEDLENLSGGKQLKRRHFNRLVRQVRYKAEEEGLWADVEVHPSGTSTTCPECGHRAPANRGGNDHPRLTTDEFQCQKCRHEAHADLNAARMIAIRALWKISGGKDTGCETASEYARTLSARRSSQSRAPAKEAPEPSSAP
jgi:IS605 OrfB family transposase